MKPLHNYPFNYPERFEFITSMDGYDLYRVIEPMYSRYIIIRSVIPGSLVEVPDDFIVDGVTQHILDFLKAHHALAS